MKRQSLFRAALLLKHTDIEMAEAFIKSYDFSGFTHARAYQRDIVTITNGSVKIHRATILRVRVHGSMSKHTISILPDILIKHCVYSIRFIMLILFHFQNRIGGFTTVDAFCYHWGIARSTLYKWKRLFQLNCSSWISSLLSADALCLKYCAASCAPSSVLPGSSTPFQRRSQLSKTVVSSNCNDRSGPECRT